MRILLLTILAFAALTVSAQTVEIVGGQVHVDGRLVLGLNDCFNSIPVDGGLGYDGGCRRAAGDCDGFDGVGEKFAPLQVYSRSYRDAGFNTFRMGRGGACNPSDPDLLASYERQLKLDGWAVWTSLYFSGDPLIDTPQGVAYLDTLYDKLSPYTDIWEITGESRPSISWFNQIVTRLRERDTKHRPITTSWNDASYAAFVDINSPHWYYGGPDIPAALHDEIGFEYQKMPEKPMVFGEGGNSGQNWSKANTARLHDFITTAFSEGVGFIFWNTSNSKDFQSESANIYLGPEERAEVQSLLGIVPIPAPRHLPTPVPQVPRRKPCWLTPGVCQ